MNFQNKDWLKFALELYEKTKDMGFTNYWDKGGLESLIDVANKFTSTGIGHTQPDKGEKIQQEASFTDQEKIENEVFWQQETGPVHSGTFVSGATKSGYNVPVSVHETNNEISIHVIIPGIASRDDLNLLLSHEALELSGVRTAVGFSGGDKRIENFYKKVRLPALVDPSGATATYRNGFLYIRVPKKSLLSPLKMEVKFE
ncbi:Hsp20/alpha crystallin family protein [Pelotomaculum propionicicum]|uniref:SHSP domain-containing protein n=1 Tax=Pelotomaculum propionicicum TaxID=258475 RepID=A0A4Y7RVY8_9FIRM|nr:Hsp20/alpha crystallin family protein [Pelotomaculum propionicicum]NLI12895.1 Hsp20/alpha crystallin family protein [Peptococcaceae bacterium]TEB13145.1 hypothetical protein Pmgp_00441 [Pelotomaculum propionicicum]